MTKREKNTNKLLQPQPLQCIHCGAKFRSDKTIYAHLCEQKRRALQKDEKRVQVGFHAFNRFFYLTQNGNTPKTYEEFCKSPYYNAFVKFGSFVNNVEALYPDKFIDHVIKSGIKLDHWCKDKVYESYLYEMIKVEPVESAVQRSLQTMMEWADEKDAVFSHYFLYVNHNRAASDIANGKISPWILLNCKSGKQMLKSFNDDHLNIIAPAFDLAFWQRKFKEVPADAALVREICKETKID